MAIPLFRFEQSVSQLHYRAVEAVQMCPQTGHAKTCRHNGEARTKSVYRPPHLLVGEQGAAIRVTSFVSRRLSLAS